MSEKKNNAFLFYGPYASIQIAEQRLICRDCAYWRSDKNRMKGICSRTKQPTTLINKCYQTTDEMYGKDSSIWRDL